MQLSGGVYPSPLTRALGAFTKIMLAPGESRVVSLAAHPLARRGVQVGAIQARCAWAARGAARAAGGPGWVLGRKGG